MKNPIFRKKSLERVSSPEQLNDYIRVTSPGVWIILTVVLLLLVGLIVWGTVGRLETRMSMVAVSEEGKVSCYVRSDKSGDISEGDIVYIGDGKYAVETISAECIQVDESFIAKTYNKGGLAVGEWVYVVTLNAELPSGVYEASVITGSVSPISFLFN